MTRLWDMIADVLENHFSRLLLIAVMVGLSFGTGFLLGHFRHCKGNDGRQDCATGALSEVNARAEVYEKQHKQKAPVEEPQKLTFYETLNAPAQPRVVEAPTSEKHSAVEQKVEVKPDPKLEEPKEESQEGPPPPKLPEEKPSAERMAQALANVLGGDTPSSVKQTAKSTSGKPHFAVQVASLPDKNAAFKLQKQLQQKGYRVEISAGNIPGRGTYYRVRMTGFVSRERAEAERVAFQQKEGQSAIVVME